MLAHGRTALRQGARPHSFSQLLARRLNVAERVNENRLSSCCMPFFVGYISLLAQSRLSGHIQPQSHHHHQSPLTYPPMSTPGRQTMAQLQE